MTAWFRFCAGGVLALLLLWVGPALGQPKSNFGYEMFQRHGAVMLLIDAEDGSIVDANQAAVDYYGYPQDRLRGMRIQDINTLSEAETRQEFESAARENRNYFIFRHRLANGEIRPVEVYSWPMDHAGRRILFSIIHDVSQRQTLEDALVRSEVQLRYAERVAGVGHWTYDFASRTYSFSDGARKLLGLETNTLPAEAVVEMVLPEFRAQIAEARRQLLEIGKEYTVTLKFRRPTDGRILVLENRGIFDPAENKLFGVSHDITDFARAMDTLETRTRRFVLVMTLAILAQFAVIVLLVRAIRTRKQAEAALQDREASLQRNECLLREKSAELENFTYTVSHDLKSPLVTIQTFLGYVRADIARGSQNNLEKDFNYIEGATARMAQLLGDLGELSRVGRIDGEKISVAYRDLVRDAVDMVAGRIAERGVALDIAEADLTLVGDRSRLVAIWQNLVENAVKYMGDQAEPRVEIGVSRAEGSPVFHVRDNGMGIESKHREMIFGLFKRIDNEGEGTGFGLALVKRIVEMHGGRIWVESQGLGQGSCFFFILPEAEKVAS
ncbi:sensor histidine kinase [Geoalkalibacter sp.]|uniref:sensor histidine kinase n=1 Tax=Geoalkalibacter sp. TaxID=3041440 RepID=UPI00272E84BB|nr:ATP-binding protein [Geoalkalibacter sp.]